MIKNRPARLREHFNNFADQLCISIITLAELIYGAEKSVRPHENLTVVEQLCARLEILPFAERAASHHGQLWAELERAGQPIGIHDMMIGGHARGEGLTVVTTNIRESSACRGFVLKIGSRHKAVGKPGLPSTRRWGGAAWGGGGVCVIIVCGRDVGLSDQARTKQAEVTFIVAASSAESAMPVSGGVRRAGIRSVARTATIFHQNRVLTPSSQGRAGLRVVKSESKQRTSFLHAGQYRAALPQQRSRSVVACRRRRRGRETLVEVLPRRRIHVRRGREIDDCFGTFGRRYGKRLGQPEQVRNWAAALITKACRDETGMQAIRGDARAMQPAGELSRK